MARRAYQSYQDLKDRCFPWWSIATISRTMKSLEEKGLIVSGNFNHAGFDRTQWYALNEDGLRQLESIRLEDEDRRWKEHRENMARMGSFRRR